jgi:hypothetical protein
LQYHNTIPEKDFFSKETNPCDILHEPLLSLEREIAATPRWYVSTSFHADLNIRSIPVHICHPLSTIHHPPASLSLSNKHTVHTDHLRSPEFEPTFDSIHDCDMTTRPG